MMQYIAFLRGINVSGKNKLKMADLKTSLQELGLEAVQTYIQSGNLLFETEVCERAALENKIARHIKQSFGYEVPVVVRTVQELADIQQNNPFLKAGEPDVAHLHVTFLAAAPSADKLGAIPSRDKQDEWHILGNETYLLCPNGYGRTLFTNTFFEKKWSVQATTRNWKTVCKMLDMAASMKE